MQCTQKVIIVGFERQNKQRRDDNTSAEKGGSLLNSKVILFIGSRLASCSGRVHGLDCSCVSMHDCCWFMPRDTRQQDGVKERQECSLAHSFFRFIFCLAVLEKAVTDGD